MSVTTDKREPDEVRAWQARPWGLSIARVVPRPEHASVGVLLEQDLRKRFPELPSFSLCRVVQELREVVHRHVRGGEGSQLVLEQPGRRLVLRAVSDRTVEEGTRAFSILDLVARPAGATIVALIGDPTGQGLDVYRHGLDPLAALVVVDALQWLRGPEP